MSTLLRTGISVSDHQHTYISKLYCTFDNWSTRSGYFLLISSEFRLKTATVPSASLCTCTQIHKAGNTFMISTYLGAFSVILVFASESLVLKPIKDFANSFGRFSQHRFQRHSRSQLALFSQAIDANFQKSWNYFVVGRQLASVELVIASTTALAGPPTCRLI